MATAPALVEVILKDEDPHAQPGALSALRLMRLRGREALPAPREAARDGNRDVQRRAEDALKEIERTVQKDDR
jgi:hypothetical protein